MMDLVLKEENTHKVNVLVTRQELDTLAMALNNLRNEMKLEAMCSTDQERVTRINNDLTGLYEAIAKVR